MPDNERIGIIAERFQEAGHGLVLLCAFTDTDFRVRCFSTVSKNDIYSVLESVAANVSLMAFDLAQIMNGMHVVKPPNEELNEQAEWAADYLDREEPMLVACVGQEVFSAFAVGDAPMITYIAVRMLTTLKQEEGLVLNPFSPSMN
jgi:hypothetical protein